MPAPKDNSADIRTAVQTFVSDTVNLIIEHLDPQQGHPLEVSYRDHAIESELSRLISVIEDRFDIDSVSLSRQFVDEQLPSIIQACRLDFARYPAQDPALSNLEEVLFASNGFWATSAYRLAHGLRQLRVPVLPRAISGLAHSKTGIDIHPGASIAPGLFIDHGTGIAIGCTAIIRENVNLYNGVVLGTRSKPRKRKDEASGVVAKRHPTIESNVSLYTSAFVGGDVTVGDGATIGAYAFVTHDVAPGTLVQGKVDEEDHDDVDPPTHGPALATEGDAPATVRSVLDLIGSTPCIELTRVYRNPNVKIYAKLEGSNPSGSVKDRIALSLIEQAEKSGALTKDKVILESTSGNTGIGLAMVAAAKGYEVTLTMSAAMSEERKKVLRAFGATLIETDPTKGTGGAIERARQMAAEDPSRYWMANQHASSDNPLAHYERTAEEILRQVPDVTHFVVGIGTFGTLRGAGVRLREATGAKVIGVEPKLGQAIQGLRNMHEPFSPELYDESLLDEKLIAYADDAYHYARLLARREGLLMGMSSGAALHGAIRLAERLDSGTIVVMFPDHGEKYLSTTLFDESNSDRSVVDFNSTDQFVEPEAVFTYSI